MRRLRLQLLTTLLACFAGVALAQQVCPAGHTLTAPDSRYAVQTDTSQVKDLKTSLVWQRCSLGQTWSGSTCTGSATAMTWQAGLTAARAAGSSGGFAWRVPNIKELASLPELACYNPAINATMFPATPTTNRYWSSSSEGNPGFAWYVGFYHGDANYSIKINSYYIRLVRSSQ